MLLKLDNMIEDLERKLPDLPLHLKKEILEKATCEHIPSGTEILREGQFVKVIPLVLEGLIRVASSYHDKELLLYYIKPEESCIMSFSAGLWNLPSKVYAIAEKDTHLMLLPVSLVQKWLRNYPSLNLLFYGQFNQRYDDLLLTIHQVLFEKLDKRLLDYLKSKSHLGSTLKLDLRHHQIARDLGTAREVISRVMKKLESEKHVIQHSNYIEIL